AQAAEDSPRQPSQAQARLASLPKGRPNDCGPVSARVDSPRCGQPGLTLVVAPATLLISQILPGAVHALRIDRLELVAIAIRVQPSRQPTVMRLQSLFACFRVQAEHPVTVAACGEHHLLYVESRRIADRSTR